MNPFDFLKGKSAFCLVVLMSISTLAYADTKIIPLPASMTVDSGAPFTLGRQTRIIAGADGKSEALELARELRAATGFPLPLEKSGTSAISLTLDAAQVGVLGPEGYRLNSSARGVSIVAATEKGLFYGCQTLRQLLPPLPRRNDALPGEKVVWSVPAVSIQDRPRFSWRGVSLDESRQFFGADYVKHLLDNMAALKLNVLQWHLTDDEGWRLEIKSLPKLTEVGAWRGSETALPNVRGETHRRYGGFYTQEQVRDIIAYARARHIDIMPEIDLPGHALALVTAYPEAAPLQDGGGISANGFTANVISPVRPEALAIVDRIYDEVAALFPFEYIHIGGDEVNHQAWSKDPQIKAAMAQGNIKSLHDLQVAFTKRTEGVVAGHGKKLFGWNEIMDDRLDKGTGIMSWTGTNPGYDAARRGYPVVMVPGSFSYFDMGYGGATGEPPTQGWAGDVTLPKIYSFDPLMAGGGLPVNAKARILGVQAALWSEYVRPWQGDYVDLDTYAKAADYRLFPRLFALAEVAWTPQSRRDYSDFTNRLDLDQYRRLEASGTYFRVPLPDAITLKAGLVQMRGPFPGADIRYTFDGTTPDSTSQRYEKPFALEGRDAGRMMVRTFIDGRGSTPAVGAEPEPIGQWSENELTAQPRSFNYDASAELTSGGIWRVVFNRSGGDKTFRLESAAVTVNGAVVAQSQAPDLQNNGTRAVARLKVPDIPAGAKVVVVATLAAPEGGNVRGAVTLVKSERLEPLVQVASAYPGYQDNTADKAGDWDEGTKFWIADYPKADVLATWTFPEPVSVQHIALPTGERGGTRDQLIGGQLEISEDGVNFRPVAAFTRGFAEVEFPAVLSIRALRVVGTETQKTWTILRDPVLR